ncbi:MAG TPA: hypothetical protein EYP77_03600 [Anaerolineae bacterium]|nr:hypothetical protein [Anaerolineae bacterium]
MKKMKLPTYIQLDEAARRYGVSREALTRAVADGIMRAVRTPEGGVLVASEDVRKVKERDELWATVAHLENRRIGIHEASQKYNLSLDSLYRWIRLGYIRVVEDAKGGGRGRKRLLNEADVAYASRLADIRGRGRGRRIFSEDMIPPHVAHLS